MPPPCGALQVDIFHTFVNLIQVAASRPPHVDSTAQRCASSLN